MSMIRWTPHTLWERVLTRVIKIDKWGMKRQQYEILIGRAEGVHDACVKHKHVA